MPTKKKSVVISKNKQSPVTSNNKSQMVTLLSWIFSPMRPIDWKKYSYRIATFVFGVIISASILGALSMNLQLAVNPEFAAMNPSIDFWSRLSMFPTFLLGLITINPLAFIMMILILTLLGAFAFMPRQNLSRKSFLAISWTMTAWLSIASILIFAFKQISLPILAIVTAIMFISIVTMYSAIVNFANGLKIQKWKIILAFPFGYSFYKLIGYFLPVQKSGTELKIKYNWYNKFIDFLITQKLGIAFLIAFEVSSLTIFPYPWSIFISGAFLVGVLMLGVKNMINKIPTLAWIPVITNIVILISGIVVFEFFPQIVLSVMNI